MNNKSLAFTLALLITITGCQDDPAPSMEPEAERFLNEVVGVMEKNSINRKTIDWQDFKTKVFKEAKGATTIASTYPAVKLALQMLGDHHSFFVDAQGQSFNAGTSQCNAETIVKPSMPAGIGYVRVNAFSGGSNDDKAVAFAREIQSQIKAQDSEQITGWIVDLRSNLGGNMWPMLAGIGPIL